MVNRVFTKEFVFPNKRDIIVISTDINPSAWGHLNPSSYCDVGRFFYGVFKFGAKSCSFVNIGWILMQLETKYLGMSKRFEYPIKSYLKNF